MFQGSIVDIAPEFEVIRMRRQSLGTITEHVFTGWYLVAQNDIII
jgi:hypothetical protein